MRKQLTVILVFLATHLFATISFDLALKDSIPIDTLNIRFNLDEERGILIESFNNFSSKKYPNLISFDKPIFKDSVDVEFQYSLMALSEDILSYEKNIFLYDSRNQPIFSKYYSDKSTKVEILIEDALETGLYFGETYYLEINCKLNGINCNQSPSYNWTFKENWYSYTPLMLGTVSAIVGGVVYQNHKTPKNDYLDKWKNGSSKELANSDFTKATENKKRGARLVNYGLGTALVGSILLFRSYRQKYLPQKKLFEKYCGKIQEEKDNAKHTKVLIQPAMDGLGIALQF